MNIFKYIHHKVIHLTTPGAIILAAVILGTSHLGYGLIMTNGTTSSGPSTVTAFKGRAIDESDMLTGKTSSKVVVLEYSDTECPFCAQLHPTIKKIKEEYSSKVAFAYRYFPLTQIHKNAFEEARLIHCVGITSGAEKREEYITKLFEEKFTKQNMTFAPGRKEALASEIGISASSLGTCMKDESSKLAVDASMQDGVTAGVQGTPATFVLYKTKKGYDVISLIDGARPYEFFKAVIDEALAK
jgi:protein-disulfide isomerase